ncbi:hypothetical protein ACQ10C_14875 [Enterococcus faecalis]|uniref:hypothetical protein n=1 Tax=Enterococcus faecalis TaxID=1351 RepID=UPI003D6C63BD
MGSDYVGDCASCGGKGRISKNQEDGGQADLETQEARPTPWHTERHGYDPT